MTNTLEDLRRWLPSEWLDEVIPETLEKPDDFIQPDGKGKWRLAYRAGHPDAEGAVYRLPLVDGEIVDFSWTTSLGDWEVGVGEGSKPLPPAGYPHHATHHAIDPGTMGDGLEELFEIAAGWGELPEPCETVDVHAYTWGNEQWRFLAEPTPHFEIVTGKPN